MTKVEKTGFLGTAITVGLYGVAMAYLEAAVVVYLQRALKIEPGVIFPLRSRATFGNLGGIEVGREAATLIMLGAIGWLVGKSGLERLAWTSIAFGIWDLGYYGFLWIFIGWPTKLTTFDLLFLLPVPWVSPVWAPMAVSVALIGCGLIVARRLRRGDVVHVRTRNLALAIVGGLVVILSFTIDARHILDGGIPTTYAWPVFLIGMAVALYGVAPLLRKKTPLSRRERHR